jgi:hypothetical protein
MYLLNKLGESLKVKYSLLLIYHVGVRFIEPLRIGLDNLSRASRSNESSPYISKRNNSSSFKKKIRIIGRVSQPRE